MYARDIMTSGERLHKVSSESTLSEASATMRSHNVSALPVVDSTNRLTGILSERDMLDRCSQTLAQQGLTSPEQGLNWFSAMSGSGLAPSGDEVEYFKAYCSVGRSSVDGAMTKEVTTAGESDSLKQLLTTMAANGINHIPIVDESRHLMGIVARSDIIKALAAESDSGSDSGSGSSLSSSSRSSSSMSSSSDSSSSSSSGSRSNSISE